MISSITRPRHAADALSIAAGTAGVCEGEESGIIGGTGFA
jgi:hypothetical protein